MKFESHQIYHIYNQGNNRQKIFHSERDYAIFFNYTNKLILPCVELLAYCLMPNHFHFLAYTKEASSILIKQGGLVIYSLTNSIRKLLSGYARIFNTNYNRTGSLFRQKTKAKWVTGGIREDNRKYTIEEYCRNCFHYIHDNPVAAGLVQEPGSWKWSSYNFYAGIKSDELCSIELAKKFCGYDPQTFGGLFTLDQFWKGVLEAEE